MENTQIGPFLILKKVGSHRRHNVYHARQTVQDMDVALKFLRLPGDVPFESALGKIYHETQVLKRLKHEGLVRFFGAGNHEGRVFFAHELIDGESLYALLTRLGRMAPDLVIDFGAQIARAFDYLHQNELVYNNLSTEKVIVTSENKLKLCDVRMNRQRKRRWDAAKRATLETAAYMSPEQLLGEGSTHKSDVYSLGVLLYEMVTGKLPFDPKTMGMLARDKQENKVAKVTEHVMNCPAWLDKLIMQMIRSDPKQRPHSAKAVAMTLEQIRSVDQSKSSAAAEMTRGFSALSAGADRNEARKLLGKKPIEKEVSKGPLTQSLPFLVGGLVMIGLIIALATMIPRSSKGSKTDRMAEATRLLASPDPEDWQESRRLLEKLAESSNEEVAAEARAKHKIARRKSMINRLNKGIMFNAKADIKEFNRGYELQRQRKPEEALAFFQRFVAEFDFENHREYVYDEAKERLDGLLADKADSIKHMESVVARLDEADALAKNSDTREAAHEIWNSVLDQFLGNDFLLLQTQRAESGKALFPRGSKNSLPDEDPNIDDEQEPTEDSSEDSSDQSDEEQGNEI